MGLTTGNFPPVQPAEFMQQPYRERTKVLARHWVDHGFGAPKITGLIYIAKLLFFYALGGVLVATLTSGLDPLDPASWWKDPIVYQKLVLWTLLLECLGVAGSWGPLAGHFKPFTAGWRHYARPRTIRLPPWPETVPFTNGDERTVIDAGLYVALIASLVVALVVPSAARRSRRHRRDRPDHRAAGDPRPSRQGPLPRGARRAVPARADLLRLLPVRRHDRRREAADRGRLVRRGVLEVRPPLPQRDPADGQQHPVAVRQADQAAALPQLPGGPAAVGAGGRPGPRRRHVRRACDAAGPALLAQPHGHRGGRRADALLPHVHHLDVPAGGSAGVERAVHVHRGVPVPGLPQRVRLRPRGHGPGAAGGHGRRAAVPPGARQPPPRPRVVPALDAPVRGQLGGRHLGAGPRRRGEDQPAHRQGGEDAEGPARRDLRGARGRGHHAADPRLARDAQPGPGPELGHDQPARRRRRTPTRCARASSRATRSSGSTSATATSTTAG